MNKIIFVLSLVLMGSGSTVYAANAGNGKKLYEARCHGCHDTRVHTRPNRIIHTYEDLVARVKFCDNAANTKFNESEMMDVVEHLNQSYYKFVSGE